MVMAMAMQEWHSTSAYNLRLLASLLPPQDVWQHVPGFLIPFEKYDR